MTAFDLTTIGEGQIRLTCPGGERLGSARHLRLSAACSEANVAGLLAQLGRRTSWATVLPAGHALTKRILLEYRAVGVDLSSVVLSEGGRVAVYFMEPGEDPMPTQVTYDREHTPFRAMTPEMFDWDRLLDTRIAFVTGITAALTEQTGEVVRQFVTRAARRGIPVGLDVNYRSLLWSPETARRVLTPLAEQASILFSSRRDTATVFGLTGDADEACTRLRDQLDIPVVVATDGARGVSVATPTDTRRYSVEPVPVIDRPGAGDAFIAGVLHGWLEGDLAAGIGYGQRTAASALTHHGDLTSFSRAELAAPGTTDIVR